VVKVVEGDRKIQFSFPESPEYFAFNVDRSTDGGKTYQRITGVPSMKIKAQGFTGSTDFAYADSGLINGKNMITGSLYPPYLQMN